MALITIERETNLNKVPISVDILHGMMFSKEAGAHKFIVTCTKDGEQVQLTGTVTAYVLLTNGHTQRLESGGTTPYTGIENGKAWATLHQACYAVPGRFQISIFVTDTHGVTTCVYAAVGVIQRSAMDNEYDPGDAVPTINDLEAWIAACQQATADAQDAASHAVRYTDTQTLTDAQKSVARNNISAASENDVADLQSTVSSVIIEDNDGLVLTKPEQ